MIQGQVGTINDKVSEKTLERFEKFKPTGCFVSTTIFRITKAKNYYWVTINSINY